MANAKSHSSPRFIGTGEKPYVVRVELYEIDKDKTEHVILSKGIETFDKLDDAINFAQRVWRKFSAR